MLVGFSPSSPLLIFRHLIALRDAPSVTDAVKAVAEGGSAAEATTLEALGQNDAEEVDGGGEDTGAEGDEGVEDGAGVDVAAHASPLNLALGLGQGGGGEPADAEAQGQGVANDETAGRATAFHVTEGASAVGGATVEHAAVARMDVVLRGAM